MKGAQAPLTRDDVGIVPYGIKDRIRRRKEFMGIRCAVGLGTVKTVPYEIKRAVKTRKEIIGIKQEVKPGASRTPHPTGSSEF